MLRFKNKFICEKSKGMQLKTKLGITKSLENLAILRRCGHFLWCIFRKKVIYPEECYLLHEQTMPNSLRISLFPYSKFLK